MGSEGYPKALTMETLNRNVIDVMAGTSIQTIRRYEELTEEDPKSSVSKPALTLLNCSIGDCHEGGQKPITFIRQVLALCSYPGLQGDACFPEDVKFRAEKILRACKGGSLGCYSDPWGLKEVRQDVARYISERDGYPSDFKDIFLSSGATESVLNVSNLLLTGKNATKRTGFMIPIPQYFLYSASIAMFGAYTIPYYLEEGNKWFLDTKELERAIAEAKPDCTPRALVVINPGNPAGYVLSKENIVEIIKFAYRHRLFLMADEVYQQNIWADSVEFISFKKTLMEMGPPYNQVQLASFMSASKGFMGECGIRAGYVEASTVADWE
ncbi:alanine aminotransferase 2 [Elysia marginata]|uniref:Alanine aminotransferase 1 n=1 Tax=Elysia marginata TaxID=1093978 RepID=A0AAV4JDR7_9GAST|nr:alanine aminotransferase 2 [Elysia marginata]